MQKKLLFSFHKETQNEDFWQQMRQLDDMCEYQEHLMQGFSVSLESKSGKIDVPFVRFRKNFTPRAS